MTATAVASWLLTYLIHSTILLTGAWIVSRWFGDRSLALQEILLRTALVGEEVVDTGLKQRARRRRPPALDAGVRGGGRPL